MTTHDGMQESGRDVAIGAASRRSLLGATAYLALAAAVPAAASKRGAEKDGTEPSSSETEKGRGKGKKDKKLRTQVSPQRVVSGKTAQISGNGYPPIQTGGITWQATGAWIASITTNKKGEFRTRVTIPAGLASGSYKLTVSVGAVSRQLRVEVSGAQPAPGPSPVVGRAWGIFHPNTPENPAWLAPGDTGQLGRLIQNIGKVPGILMWYQAWGLDATKEFNPALLAMVRDAGSVPMITWEPWNPWDHWDVRFRPTQLLKGSHDAYIRSWAQGLKDYGGPVMLRWGHEANGFWYPWAAQWGAQAGDPPNAEAADQYVRSWKRIRQIFREVYGGPTTNIAWVWCPNIDFTGATPFSMIYPGMDHVDWSGLDGYNWYSDPEKAWKSFGDIFDASLGILRSVAPGKPVVIGEVASHDDRESVDRKAQWIRQSFLQDIPQRHPEIRSFVWFNEDKERDWAVTKWNPGEAWDPAWQQNRIRSLAAFREVAASEYWDGVPMAAVESRARRSRD